MSGKYSLLVGTVILVFSVAMLSMVMAVDVNSNNSCGIMKRDVIKGIVAYMKHEAELPKQHVLLLIRAYLGNVDCSDDTKKEEVDDVIEDIDDIPDDVVPSCSDGTPYSSCSDTKPKYCYLGQLVERCDLCCASGECGSDGGCYDPNVVVSVDSPCLPKGDMDSSGKLNQNDVEILYDLADDDVVSDENLFRGDLNGNGMLDFDDVVVLNNLLVGKISTFTVCGRSLASPCPPLGDMDLNDILSPTDVGILYDLADDDVVSDDNLLRGDLNGNGMLDFDDVVVLNDFVTGNIDTFPACDGGSDTDYVDCRALYGEDYWCSNYDEWKMECMGVGAAIYMNGSNCIDEEGLYDTHCATCLNTSIDPGVDPTLVCHLTTAPSWFSPGNYTAQVMDRGCDSGYGIEYQIRIQCGNYANETIWVTLEPGLPILNRYYYYSLYLVQGNSGVSIVHVNGIDTLGC